MTFITVLSDVVIALLTVMSFMLIIRVLYQFFASEESKFYMFLYACTEPIIYPVRKALNNSDFFASLPVDFSFVITYMLIMIVQVLLSLISDIVI